LPNLLVGSVGLITEPKQAEGILQDGKADTIFLARELMRHADFPIYAAQELGVAVKPANQYEFAWRRMLTPRK
jgi:2,4-dienoyl-CoA reductase-like NADH-dependent reductase (Old Yellow Enzyme family)